MMTLEILLLLMAALQEDVPGKVEFNRDVRPILLENCVHCHGPDAKARKGNLRLDTQAGAFAELEPGRFAIVPRDLGKSEFWQRITTDDPDDRMPPKKAKKRLTKHEIELLRRWIEQGAEWQPHWSFVPPRRQRLPELRNPAGSRNDIDKFILARLEREGLGPSPEAGRETLIRRLSLDLTGLPPDPREVDDFLADVKPDGYERLVDRLLASPRYGERMALVWLDAARYADTHGYHIDAGRDMWKWREWVIDAFNRNMPFDRFTVEQLAGDLLPDATPSQRIASGFNRNHPVNFEGGAIPEEYQAEYVIDRVATTSTVWMGLTMRCAQCHDHKYDPITQEDYYRFYAFFNSIDERGLDGRKGNAEPFMSVFEPEGEANLARLRREVRELEGRLHAPNRELDERQALWEAEVTRRARNLWTPLAMVDGEMFNLTSCADIQALRVVGRIVPGDLEFEAAPASAPAQFKRVRFQVASDPASAIFFLDRSLEFGEGDLLRARLAFDDDPCRKSAPDLRFSVATDGGFIKALRPSDLGTWHMIGKFYAPDGFQAFTVDHDPEREIDLAKVYTTKKFKWVARPDFTDGQDHALSDGLGVTYLYRAISAPTERKMTVSLRSNDGLKVWLNDRLVVERERPLSPEQDRVTLDLEPGENRLLLKVANYGGPLSFRFQKVGEETGDSTLDAASVPAERRTATQKAALRTRFRREQWPEWKALSAGIARLRVEEKALIAAAPTTMVMRELPMTRETFILDRGQYDQKTKRVGPGTPTSLPSMVGDGPQNRLGLARWMVDTAHPLTARVAVNRLWEMVFGTGMVETSGDFGTQGSPPSHPELLDQLALEFVETGWDVKALLRKIVTSATYRQASRSSPELEAKDPQNRLLARGSRFRLPAELIRDSALAAGGLLVEKVGGPSVKPYQPEGLWKYVAYDPEEKEFTAQKYVQGKGADLYRRSLYTFIKRSSPPPSMSALDAPGREFCVMSRSRTNTPIQALVLMNDPTFVEAAKALAQRAMKAGTGPEEVAAFAFRRVMARRPDPAELKVLLRVYGEQRASFSEKRDAALKFLLGAGQLKHDESLDPVDLAAWTMVASMILNLDEAVTKG